MLLCAHSFLCIFSSITAVFSAQLRQRDEPGFTWLTAEQLASPAQRQDGLNEQIGSAVRVEAGKPCHTMRESLLSAVLC